jgi:NAD(P)-dependent dehydrogenase (short-subunit alcohol dehydrogenase family)
LNRLEGKVALVTGGGSGIGRGAALRFAEQGARVAVGDIDAEAATRVAAEIGQDARAVRMDVTSSHSVSDGLDAVVAAFGGLDVLVNNAGRTTAGAVYELSEDEWDAVLDVNLKSVFLVSKCAWPLLQARGGGAIINTASIAGLWGLPRIAAYGASKGGVILLTKCMALDGASDGIRVNCICPGDVDTPMLQTYFSLQPDPVATRAFFTNMHPLGRLGEPRDIADAMLYLASDEARWVTGSVLVVDGGLTVGIWQPSS